MTGQRIAAFVLAATVLSVALVASGIAAAGTTGGTATVPFTASYSGKATVKITDDVADISANGSGTATAPLGKSTVSGTGKGDASKQPCVPWTGSGTMTAANGSATLRFQVVPGSQGCGDEAGKIFSIVGRANVTGGTGSLANASGSLKLTGVYDRGAGTFSVKFTGQLTTAAGGSTAQAKTLLKITGGAKNKLLFSKKRLVAKAGVVTIAMRNLSNVPHNVAIRAGTGAKSKLIAKGKVVRKGKTSTVRATLKKGKYRYVCTVRGHEKAGMWGILTVK